MTLTVALVYPELLGTYGDRGNAVVLAARARWRGIDTDLVEVAAGEALPTADVYCLGGGEDGPELRAAESLRADGTLVRAVERGAAVVAVCGGYQILGRTFPAADGRPLPGLGLLDVATTKGTGRRAVGELLAQPVPGLTEVDDGRGAAGGRGDPGQLALLTGFENHGGLTRLGPEARPLARVVAGVGNGDGTEGALAGKVVGTYLHGPLLARNPALADLFLSWATGAVLAPLDDAEEESLRAERIAAHRRAPGRPWRMPSATRRAARPGPPPAAVPSGPSGAVRDRSSPAVASDVGARGGAAQLRWSALVDAARGLDEAARRLGQSKLELRLRSAVRSALGAAGRAGSRRTPSDRAPERS